MGVIPRESRFPPGSLVVVERGRHTGSVFVVVGECGGENDGRILIADGKRISARRPKRKNPRHVKAAGMVSAETAKRLARGCGIDDGWLAEVVSRLEKGESRLEPEEDGQSVCRKTTS